MEECCGSAGVTARIILIAKARIRGLARGTIMDAVGRIGATPCRGRERRAATEEGQSPRRREGGGGGAHLPEETQVGGIGVFWTRTRRVSPHSEERPFMTS